MGLDEWTATKGDLSNLNDGSFASVAFGKSAASGINEFLAVGNTWRANSPDGAPGTWTMFPTGQQLQDVAYGGGVFVAVGIFGNTYRWDGLSWAEPKPNDLAPVGLRVIAYGRVPVRPWHGVGPPALVGLFVAAGYENALATSFNGIDWTVISLPATQTGDYFRCIAFGNQRFIVATDGGWIFTSTDGVNWPVATQLAGDLRIRTLAFGNGGFVGITFATKATSSSDGLSWQPPASLGVTPAMSGIVYGHDTFVAVGGGGSICTSRDGKAWTTVGVSAGGVHVTEQDLGGVAYGNNRFVVVGAGGATPPMAGGDLVRSGEYPVFSLKALWLIFKTSSERFLRYLMRFPERA